MWLPYGAVHIPCTTVCLQYGEKGSHVAHAAPMTWTRLGTSVWLDGVPKDRAVCVKEWGVGSWVLVGVR
jgi:hypothetical protein